MTEQSTGCNYCHKLGDSVWPVCDGLVRSVKPLALAGAVVGRPKFSIVICWGNWKRTWF